MGLCLCLQPVLRASYSAGEPEPCKSAIGLAGGILGDGRTGTQTTCLVLADGCAGRGNAGKRTYFADSLGVARDQEEPGWAIDCNLDILGFRATDCRETRTCSWL